MKIIIENMYNRIKRLRLEKDHKGFKRTSNLIAVLIMLLSMPVLIYGQDSREQQLEIFFNRLGEAAINGDKIAYTGLFLSDAAMFLPNRAPLLGRRQIGNWFDNFQKSAELLVDRCEQEQIKIVGDVAMIRSRCTGNYRIKATGEQLPFEQKYLDVLQYQNGNWYMVYHLASSATFEPGFWELDWENE